MLLACGPGCWPVGQVVWACGPGCWPVGQVVGLWARLLACGPGCKDHKPSDPGSAGVVSLNDAALAYN